MEETITERLHFISSGKQHKISTFAEDVSRGLSALPKYLNPQYFYDREGSLLFEEISEQPEYYPTRTELSILEKNAEEISRLFSPETVLVELGSGSARKTRTLIEAFIRRFGRLHFIPVEISPSILRQSSEILLNDYQELSITAVAAEFETGLQAISTQLKRPKLIVWLGSSIGNFDQQHAANFLRQLSQLMNPRDRLLIGMDLVKDVKILEAAYNDAADVTAAFNLNLLKRINRELGGHFDLQKFTHCAFFNREKERIEMHLVSERPQLVAIDALKMDIHFKGGESIHTENSHKYRQETIGSLADKANLKLEKQWIDEKNWFCVNLFSAN